MEKLHDQVERVGIFLEFLSELVRRWIVKKRNVLIQVWHDEFITELLEMRQTAQVATDRGFKLAQHTQRLDIKQLDAAGLEQSCDIRRIVVGVKANIRNGGIWPASSDR
jgi:hypothetical protein